MLASIPTTVRLWQVLCLERIKRTRRRCGILLCGPNQDIQSMSSLDTTMLLLVFLLGSAFIDAVI